MKTSWRRELKIQIYNYSVITATLYVQMYNIHKLVANPLSLGFCITLSNTDIESYTSRRRHNIPLIWAYSSIFCHRACAGSLEDPKASSSKVLVSSLRLSSANLASLLPSSNTSVSQVIPESTKQSTQEKNTWGGDYKLNMEKYYWFFHFSKILEYILSIKVALEHYSIFNNTP